MDIAIMAFMFGCSLTLTVVAFAGFEWDGVPAPAQTRVGFATAAFLSLIALLSVLAN